MSRIATPLFVLIAVAAYAQTPAKFEAATIKPCKEQPVHDSGIRTSPGRLTFTCSTLASLISGAFIAFGNGPMWRPGIKPWLAMPALPRRELSYPIKGGPAWVRTQRFVIEAKAEGPATADTMQGPLMQALLTERFKLKFHREPVQVAVYELTPIQGSPKLQLWKEGGCTPLDLTNGPPPARKPGQPVPPPLCASMGVSPRGGLDSRGVTLTYFAYLLSIWMDRDIVDKTGIAGVYDFHLDLSFADLQQIRAAAPASTETAVASDPGGTLPDALRKLGLKLVPAKATVQSLVIDHAERPGEN